MSRAAGTLTTTYSASFAPPAMLPGYGGHVPTTQYQHGSTYGHATEKYFHDYRNDVLNSSQSLYSRGGYFPTTYTNDPHLVIANRRIERDRFLYNPNYELRNYDYNHTKDLRKFYQSTQKHRQQYLDRSNELHPVEDFIIPESNEKSNESYLPYSSMLLRHKSEINIPYSRNFMPPKGIKTTNEYRLFNE